MRLYRTASYLEVSRSSPYYTKISEQIFHPAPRPRFCQRGLRGHGTSPDFSGALTNWRPRIFNFQSKSRPDRLPQSPRPKTAVALESTAIPVRRAGSSKLDLTDKLHRHPGLSPTWTFTALQCIKLEYTTTIKGQQMPHNEYGRIWGGNEYPPLFRQINKQTNNT